MERSPDSDVGLTKPTVKALSQLEVNQIFPSQPLIADDRIRLLEIQPGEPDDPIYAKIFTVRTSDSPAYEAMSYTWGDPDQKEQIQISHTSAGGDQSIPTWVTTNCHAALKGLRKGATGPRAVWVDAICINQANISERNHQLTLMTQIYKGATCVVVYLGEVADGSDEAMNFIREIDMPSGYGSEGGEEQTSPREPNKSALETLFRRPWFSRVWVLQEAGMARKAVVYCGDRAVSWDSFRTFKDWNVSCMLIDELPYVVASKPGRYSYMKPAQRLLTELRDTRHCQATDPRDKLFAILPLILQLGRKDTAKNYKAIKMDYSLSPPRVFTNLAKYFLDTLGIGILYDVIGPSALAGLPSWVPDWSMKPQGKHFRNSSYLRDRSWFSMRTKSGMNIREAWSADNELLYELHAKGHSVGSIILIGDKCDLQNDTFPIALWESLQLGVESLHSVYKNNRTPRKLFCALLGAQSEDVEILEERVQIYNEGEEARQKATKELEIEEHRWGGQPKIKTWNTLFDFCMAGFSATVFEQLRRVFERCDTRRFFVTDTGLTGLASEYAQVGDSVCFVKGAQDPFVLRAEQGNHSSVAAREEQERKRSVPSRFRLVGVCSLGFVDSEDFDISFEKIVIW